MLAGSLDHAQTRDRRAAHWGIMRLRLLIPCPTSAVASGILDGNEDVSSLLSGDDLSKDCRRVAAQDRASSTRRSAILIAQCRALHVRASVSPSGHVVETRGQGGKLRVPHPAIGTWRQAQPGCLLAARKPSRSAPRRPFRMQPTGTLPVPARRGAPAAPSVSTGQTAVQTAVQARRATVVGAPGIAERDDSDRLSIGAIPANRVWRPGPSPFQP